MLNRILASVVPVMPRWAVWIGAKRYVAGKTFDEAVAKVKELNREGFSATLDILGENIQHIEETRASVNKYLELLDIIKKQQLASGISVKLSQQGLAIDEKRAWQNLSALLDKAAKNNIFIRIDMEDSPWTDKTLEFYQKTRQHYDNTGIAIQAYLYRSEADINALIKGGKTNVRICKGIYREPEEIAIQERKKINDNFFRLVKVCMENGVFTAIATHDLDLIETCRQYIAENRIPRDQYEFQALLGVPVTRTLKRLLAEGHNVRYYVPFGKDWYAYSMRRLKENPDIGGYIFKDFFKVKKR